MNEQEFLKHHGLYRNPFADEDAQTDTVFKDHCISSLFHPAWSKVYGDPREPSTAIVFGPKGSGKTAMRLQISGELAKYNVANPQKRVFFVRYDDFNRFLGRLEQQLPRRYRGKPERILHSLRLWDHMDAILCEGVTELIDATLRSNPESKNEGTEKANVAHETLERLDRGQRRDFLLLAACYDQPNVGTFRDRWQRLRSTLRFSNWNTWLDFAIGVGVMVATLVTVILLFRAEAIAWRGVFWGLTIGWVVGWFAYGSRLLRCALRSYKIVRRMRVGRKDFFTLTRVLMAIPMKELAAQPLPTAFRSDDRYALLEKFQLLLRSLGYEGLMVLVDRVDEPDLVNGQPERMRQLVWPLLDNKLLKHPGLGIKLLLPSDLQYFIDRESREFNERARLDKQNVVASFDWTGEALYDLVESRMKACATGEKHSKPTDLLDASVSEARLLAAMQSLRTPRSLFRFLYRLLADHCKTYRSADPQFKISASTFESTLAVYLNDQSRAQPL